MISNNETHKKTEQTTLDGKSNETPPIEHYSTEDLVIRLRDVVDSQAFFDTAESVLSQVKNPTDLARCAELVGRREPGGVYYRAKFWNKAEEIRASSENGFPRKSLGMLSVEAGIQYSAAKTYIAQGQVLINAEKESTKAEDEGKAFTNLSSLRHAPVAVFQYALSQKDKATEYLIEAASILEEHPYMSSVVIHNRWCQDNGSIKANLDIIKPSDWWAFSHPKWRKEDDFPGSIPGEVYANSLYYFAPRTGIAVDLMAGSGMLKRVYEDKNRWQKDTNFDLHIHLFDLYPRREFILQHDARTPLPFKADWIFIDPPYFGQSDHLFEGDLAVAKDYKQYLMLLKEVINAAVDSLTTGGKLCLFLCRMSIPRSLLRTLVCLTPVAV